MTKQIFKNDINTRSKGRLIRRTLLILTTGAAVLLFVSALFLTRSFSEAPWEEAPPHSVSIYENREISPDFIPVVSPFHLQTEPMEGLLLINFENDADTVYVGFEPQAFDDDVHGRGILVIGWRADGRVDVFHDPGLRLDPRSYGITGKGLHATAERSFSEAFLEFGPAGVQADIAFRDLQGRQVRLVVRETDTRPRNTFGFLAPMGSAASDPPALPLVYVDEFYFVRRSGSEIRIEIEGRPHQSDFIPLILDGARVHFVRYSTAPFIVTWNPDTEAATRILKPDSDPAAGGFIAHAGGVRYEIEANGAFREIRRMSRREGKNEAVVEFSPAVPQLLALADGVEAAGEFRITAQPSVGVVRGSWRVRRQGGYIHLEAAPDGGWIPGHVPMMARALFRVVPMFRAWPATYIWRGDIQLPPPGKTAGEPLLFRSGWERIEP